ncbi:hypothetical protein [uncultured Pseudoteredinibacter sp.]|uniref:hypothetical protein n=1 Tax=uncultured Pseudoteredinibacter sp. TaxID=1641701 RepID=UPI00262AC071|nr:hypothetical protein [uncultured Pseudoteredinibacter sp.]
MTSREEFRDEDQKNGHICLIGKIAPFLVKKADLGAHIDASPLRASRFTQRRQLGEGDVVIKIGILITTVGKKKKRT